ncbi:MAG: mannonate dehydratase [Synergistaceae bacterium]|jgi:mannonate dehydratase|nr:mannonate dehydratase [Synergistaceae bacterium]
MNFVKEYHGNSNIKISNRIDAEESDDFLQFLQQMGIDCCYAWIKTDQDNYDFLARLKERTAKYHLNLFNLGSLDYAKSYAVHRGLPERDRDIERLNNFINVLGKIGVPTTTITWESQHAYATSPEGWVVKSGQPRYQITTRGGAPTRLYDQQTVDADPLSKKLLVTKEETWANFEYFVKATVPTAEESKVRICLHPNDPPVPSSLGVATLIENIDDYRRAFEIAESDFFGMEFCCGCWLEGGRAHFSDIFQAIQEFVKAGKVSIVHFRNVSGTLPYFIETFVDDGYADMYQIMKTFVEAGYNGTMIYDHSPDMTTGLAAQTAFAIGYIKALRQAAQSEVHRGIQ